MGALTSGAPTLPGRGDPAMRLLAMACPARGGSDSSMAMVALRLPEPAACRACRAPRESPGSASWGLWGPTAGGCPGQQQERWVTLLMGALPLGRSSCWSVSTRGFLRPSALPPHPGDPSSGAPSAIPVDHPPRCSGSWLGQSSLAALLGSWRGKRSAAVPSTKPHCSE